jgi:hypothetical protein
MSTGIASTLTGICTCGISPGKIAKIICSNQITTRSHS